MILFMQYLVFLIQNHEDMPPLETIEEAEKRINISPKPIKESKKRR